MVFRRQNLITDTEGHYLKAYADKMGLVEVINQVVPTEMAIDPGTMVLGMVLDTLRGRSPLYR